LRRDIVHRVFRWRERLYKYNTKAAKTVGTVSGSGKKMTPQKKTGGARHGNKRAPGMKKGGKAHGPVVRSFRI